MIKYLSPDRIANSIMQKTGFKGTYLIVEGNSDYTLFKKFTSQEFCSIEIAFGNSNVNEVVEELNSRGFMDAIGIIDADFRNLDKNFPVNKNIFLTDDHDIELMIFRSPAFETVLGGYCEESKLKNVMDVCNNDLRKFFLDLATPIGYLKWANKSMNFGLLFKPIDPNGKGLTYSNFIPVKTLEFVGYGKMVETVINYSVNKRKIATTIKNAVSETENLISESIDVYQLCNGHDVSQIICLALRSKIGSLNANAISGNQIEKELIFAYDSRFFEKTELFGLIKKWENANNKQVLNF